MRMRVQYSWLPYSLYMPMGDTLLEYLACVRKKSEIGGPGGAEWGVRLRHLGGSIRIQGRVMKNVIHLVAKRLEAERLLMSVD